jgi:hypothetical protein
MVTAQAAPGGVGDLAETPIKVAGSERDEWDDREECGRIKPDQAQSSRIKVNQGKSSQLGYPIDSTNPKV